MTERRKPTDRPRLTRYGEHAREFVALRLRQLGRPTHWLAERAASDGLATRATIAHWMSGRNGQIGCGLYLALCDILREEEARCRDCD